MPSRAAASAGAQALGVRHVNPHLEALAGRQQLRWPQQLLHALNEEAASSPLLLPWSSLEGGVGTNCTAPRWALDHADAPSPGSEREASPGAAAPGQSWGRWGPCRPVLTCLGPGQARGGHHFLSQAKTEVRGHLGARYRGPAARGGRGSPRRELVGVAVSGAWTLHQVPHSCTRWRWVGPVHTHPPTRPPEQGAHTHPPTSPPEQGARSQASLIKVYSYTSLQSCRRGGAVCGAV